MTSIPRIDTERGVAALMDQHGSPEAAARALEQLAGPHLIGVPALQADDAARSLGDLDPDTFAWTPDAPDDGARNLRARLRAMAALPGLRDLDPAGLATAIAEAIDSPAFDRAAVVAALADLPGEPPVAALQAVGRKLAAGADCRQVAGDLELDQHTVTTIDQLLGVTEWRARRDLEAVRRLGCLDVPHRWAGRRFEHLTAIC